MRKTADMKKVYLLRHAKAGWGEPGIPDHDRPLDEKGIADCSKLARYLLAATIEPQLVLCSSAVRARRTLMAILPGMPHNPRSVIAGDLYLATAETVLETLRGLDEAVGSVMVIGHNPGLQDLVVQLATEGPDLERARKDLPPAGLATITTEQKWGALSSGTLASLVVPDEL